MANTCSLKDNKIFSQESNNWMHMLITLFERTTWSRTTLRCAKRKHRRFWITMNCQQQTSVKDSFDFELQSRLHLDVITLLHKQGRSLTIFGRYIPSGCAGFFCCPKVGWQLNDRPNGIWFCDDLSLSESERNNASWQGAGTTFGQNGRKDRNNGSGDVADRNKQGNCIDSFRRGRLQEPISL